MCLCYSVTCLIVVLFLMISLSTSFKITPEGTGGVFPQVIEPTDFVPKISTTKCHPGQTFCEHTDSYPYNLIRNLRNEEQYKYLFGIEEVEVISDRIDETEFVCASKSMLIFPKAAVNSKNQWKYIVNQGKGREQGIRVVMCQREGSTCKHTTRELFRTSCKQQYAYRRLLAISKNGTIEADWFRLPVSCCCAYKPKILWNPSG